MCGSHPVGPVHRACQTGTGCGGQHGAQNSLLEKLRSALAEYWQRYPLPVAGGAIALIPLVAMTGMSLVAFLASLLVPLLVRNVS